MKREKKVKIDTKYVVQIEYGKKVCDLTKKIIPKTTVKNVFVILIENFCLKVLQKHEILDT